MNTEPAPNSNDEAIVETAPVSVDSMAEEAAANEQQDVPEVTRPSGSVTVDGDASYQSLPMEALRLERFVGGIFIVIVGVVCLIGMIIPLFVSPATPEVLAGVVFGCLVLFAAVVYGGWIYPKAAHRCASWKISEHGLEIRRGVWWRHRIVVPHSRMQHSDIEQGPLQRMYSLATLVIHTAGTKNSSVQLENLNAETADQLRDALTSGHWEVIVSSEQVVTE